MRHDVIEVESGVFSILLDGVSHEARVDDGSIWIDGEAFAFEAADPRKWKRGSSGTSTGGRVAITAPMPGKVVRLLVATDEEVTAGQGIVVVEAMKMQNELKAPRAARVSSINVKEGENVNAGAVLAVLE